PTNNPPSYAPGGHSQPPQAPATPPEYAVPVQAPTHQEPSGPPGTPPGPPPAAVRRPKRRRKRGWLVFTFILVLLLAWPIGLGIWANGKLNHTDALSGASATSGTTYLLAGSDSRA